MKAVIINCFDTYEDRVDLVYNFFKKKGYDVTVIQSDFRHFKKVFREERKKDFVFVETRSYYKNLSAERLFSHYKFSEDAFKIVKEINPDLLYTFAPPNSLVSFASKYKQKNKNVKLIYDVIDLWPETIPISKIIKDIPFVLWKQNRNRGFKGADLLITECDLYQDVLGKAIKNIKVETIYLAKKEINVTRSLKLSENEINLAYLGSINNIIDIQKIKEIIHLISEIKPVTLHVIGDGESKQKLINEAKSAGAEVKYHGTVYDSQKKQEIFDKCHFGLNIMKENVCVGLTMKSIDYFQHGLPIINNIPADTREIVDKYGVGVNTNSEKDFITTLFEMNNLSKEEQIDIRKKTLNLFEKKFSFDAYFDKIESVYRSTFENE